MPSAPRDTSLQPRWEVVATHLESLASQPTSAQLELARSIGLTLESAIPAHVAAVVLRHELREALFDTTREGAELPDALKLIEEELAIESRATLLTGTREEVSAWFAARYAAKSALGLRQLKPEPGDIVSTQGWSGERRVVSSIGADGRIYMRGRPPRSAWPNYLTMVVRAGEPGHETAAREIDAALRNRAAYANTNFAKLEALRDYELTTNVPSLEALRALEELLDSGERMEEPFQALLTRHPALLAAATVVGGWATYVIPKQRLGAEHVTDFLVLGVNSLGPQWVAVELEAPRHGILISDGSLSKETRHGVKQVHDWREWLTSNVAYAHSEHHLYGLTNHVAGLVIIGRDDPKSEREASRAQSEEGQRVAIRSWDWLLRHAQKLAGDSAHRSDFASAHSLSGVARTPRMGPEDQFDVGRPEANQLNLYELDPDDIF